MGKADLHVHSRVSDGLATVEQIVLHAEHETDLDVIAITDHEDAAGGLRGQEFAAKRGGRLQVVPGAEVTTMQGHLLALFVERCPKSFRSMERTLEDIHAQGGVAVVPHPMSWLTRSVSKRTLDRIQHRGEAGVTFDAVEGYNPSPAGRLTAARTRAMAGGWGLPQTGGSDAHHLPHMGSGWTEFEGKTADELRLALHEGRVKGEMTAYPPMRHVGITRLVLGLAWGYSATPRKMLRLSRRSEPDR
ncbi:MAG TPA: PHP-associated domain-containing protein [Tepidiformaceae bacterium]|nr:PHP-associated domain-containing protein [Tepidiformaceae bacterium]